MVVLLNSLDLGLHPVVDVAFAPCPCVVCLGFRGLRKCLPVVGQGLQEETVHYLEYLGEDGARIF